MTARWHYLALWLGLTGCCAITALYWQWSAAVTAFERDVSTLHRIVSQRVEQHDAHMTALSALVASGEGQSQAPLKAVAANIVEFYPRIVAIDIIALRPEVLLLSSSRNDPKTAPVASIADAAKRATARTELIATPQFSGRYFLVKLIPTPETRRYVASLEIDGKRLVEAETGPSFSQIALLIEPSGSAVYASPNQADAMQLGNWPLRTERSLPSTSQPLHLLMTRHVSLPALFPWAGIGVASLVIAGILYLLRAIMLARQATRAAMRKATASAQEARLAHATRINAMGELSLAIAHELAQPIAAMLSQSQAGLRMIQTGNNDRAAISGILEANARLAKRAGDLLTKLRDWISVDPPAREHVNLDRLINTVAALNDIDLKQRGIALKLDLTEPTALASADSVGVEQIVQNLITNARDASPTGTTITIATVASADRVGFTVADQGSGIAVDLKDRLFEPFVTSKSDGMGLGLSICRRLVEKFGGEIHGANRSDGQSGTVMTVLLSRAPAGAQPEGGTARGQDLSDR
jgi:two-component system, LuxR family, sensor kinase FixL